MKNIILFILFTFLFCVDKGYSQENKSDIDLSQFSSYKLLWDNDVMMQTDYYYTQGLGMELILPVLEKNPLNNIFIKPKSHKAIYGLSVHQETYTPTIIKVEDVLYGDRPYAGALYIKAFQKSSNPEKKIYLKSEFDFGFIGPYSFAGLTQYKFHVLSDNQLPLGWANEINESPILNYNLTVNKGLITENHHELQIESRIRVGTLYDDIMMGLNYRVGVMNSYYDTAGENMYLGKNKFQAYLSFKPQIKVVGYNATMQGSPFTSNEHAYVILPHQIERFVYSIRTGPTIMYKNIGASFILNWQSPEFDGGLDHIYHSFTFIYNF